MKFLWMLYIIIGLGAVSLSFFMESLLFASVTANQPLGFSMAMIFEGSKTMTIIMHRFMIEKKEFKTPGTVRILTLLFKVGLFFLSFVCTAVFIAGFLGSADLKAMVSGSVKTEGANFAVVLLLKALREGFGMQLDYGRLVIWLSLFLSFLVETTIYVVFSYVIVSHQSIFFLQHDLLIGQETIKAKTRDALFQDKVENGLVKGKVRNRAEGIRQKVTSLAKEALNA